MRTLSTPDVILILSEPRTKLQADSFTATLLRCCFCLFRVRGALFSIQSPRPDQRRVSSFVRLTEDDAVWPAWSLQPRIGPGPLLLPLPLLRYRPTTTAALSAVEGPFLSHPINDHPPEVRSTGLAGVTIHHLACFVSPMHGVPPPTPKSASTHVVPGSSAGPIHGFRHLRSDPGLVCETVPWICPGAAVRGTTVPADCSFLSLKQSARDADSGQFVCLDPYPFAIAGLVQSRSGAKHQSTSSLLPQLERCGAGEIC